MLQDTGTKKEKAMKKIHSTESNRESERTHSSPSPCSCIMCEWTVQFITSLNGTGCCPIVQQDRKTRERHAARRNKASYMERWGRKRMEHSRKEVDKRAFLGTSLVVQWLRLWAPNARGSGLRSNQGTLSNLPQLRVCILQLKIPRATTKIWCRRINK